MANGKKRPFVIQHDERDCGAACLSMVAEYYGKKLKLETCRGLIKVGPKGASMYGLIQGADKIGLNAEAYECDVCDLMNELKAGNAHFPLIVRVLNEEMYEHFVVLYSINEKIVTVGDPAKSKILKLSLSEFENIWFGQLIVFEKREDFVSDDEREHNITKYFEEIKRQKRFMLLVLMGSILILFINLAGTYLFRFVLSESNNEFSIWGHVVTDGIEKVCFVLVFLYLFRIFVEIIRCNILTVVTKNIDLSITMKYYKHLLKLKTETFDTRQTGDFISRFYDTGEIREAVSSLVLSAIMDAGMAVICGVLLIHLNFNMFLITLVTISLYAVIILIYGNKIKKAKNDIMAAEARVTSLLKESIDGIQTIKAYNIEKKNFKKIFGLYDRLTDKLLIGTRVVNMQNALATFVASAGIVVVIGIGYKEYLKGSLTMADLFSFYYMLDYFMGPISGLINLQPAIETAIVAADRLADVIDMEEEQDEQDELKVGLLDGDIVFNDVTFRYGYDAPVLNHLNICVRKGSKVAVVGDSGSGKTTMAKLLLGFYTPEEGTIYIGNTNLNDCPVSRIRNSIAYISQEIFLFEDSLYNNLTLGNPNIEKKEVENIVEKCGLIEFVNQLPFNYETLISEGGRNLSGGQKQRIAIARALISKKKIIIMDEVTSNLDEGLEKKINYMIDELPLDVTCIVITHREAVTRFCDNVYVLE